MAKLSHFNIRLKELLKEHQLTTDALGHAIGTSGAVIRKWTLMDRSVKLSNLINVADYFKCSIEYLIGRSDDLIYLSTKTLPSFMERLKAVMAEKGTNSYKLDKDTQVKHSYLNRWRNGGDPTLSNLILLSDYLDCTIDYLIGRE